jgi:hypothetical protein
MEWTEKALEWKRLLSEFAAEGGTRMQFCAARGIKVTTFDYWRARLSATGEASSDLVSVGRILVCDPPLRVRVNDGLFVKLDGAASSEQLWRVLQAAVDL